MKIGANLSLQLLVFFLTMAAFTNIYITQPILPVLQKEFSANEVTTSFTVSAVILGIALANLPFGALADRFSIKPIILIGGIVVSFCSLACAMTTRLWFLIIIRFIQGLFIPALTTCLAAHLARSLPTERLNVILGSYVSATVTGGLGGRLLGGWLHPPLHWQFAFLITALLLLIATATAIHWLPDERTGTATEVRPARFFDLAMRSDLGRIYLVAFAVFFAFSSLFNYLPFYLSGPAFHSRTEVITFMYLAYLIGIAAGPLSGHLSNRIGNGTTMILGSVVFGIFIGLTFVQSLIIIATSLAGICAGFFAIHAAAVGSLNRRLTSSQGRANSLYVLFYYLGGAIGITLSGSVYLVAGWTGVALMSACMLLIPLSAGIAEIGKP